jgi:hypothetical protein
MWIVLHGFPTYLHLLYLLLAHDRGGSKYVYSHSGRADRSPARKTRFPDEQLHLIRVRATTLAISILISLVYGATTRTNLYS